MSVSSGMASSHSFLAGSEGELVSIRITTDPRLLEDLLECLAELSFPINPQIYHQRPTLVEFPAYQTRLEEVREALGIHGFDPSSIQVSGMLQTISA